jgi:hypothetical protein
MIQDFRHGNLDSLHQRASTKAKQRPSKDLNLSTSLQPICRHGGCSWSAAMGYMLEKSVSNGKSDPGIYRLAPAGWQKGHPSQSQIVQAKPPEALCVKEAVQVPDGMVKTTQTKLGTVVTESLRGRPVCLSEMPGDNVGCGDYRGS